MGLKKLARKAYKHRKMIVMVASMVAPGVVLKGAEAVAKIKDKKPQP